MGKIDGIVYCSDAGHTMRFAKLLAEKTGLPMWKRAELPPDKRVIFFGWIRTGNVVGYQKAAQKAKIAAVCPVGMFKNELIQINGESKDMPVFYLRGGFDIKLVKGIDWILMRKTIRRIKNSRPASDEEAELFHVLLEGADFVNTEQLDAVVDWYRNETGVF